MSERLLLLTPGPTPVPPEVLEAMALPMIHHRTPQYQEIFSEVLKGLRIVFQTAGEVIVFASSGTGSMEAAVANALSPGDRVLVLEAGVFGQRFTKICKAFHQDARVVSVPFGESIPTDEVLEIIKKEGTRLKAVLCQLSDTSTGALMEVERLAQAVRNTDTLLIVDAISGLGVDPLKFDEWGVDIALAGSQKALMTPPGLSFVAVSEKAWKQIAVAKNPRFYFDFQIAREFYKNNDTPFTPAISLVRAVNVALKMIQKESLEKCFARHQSLARATRAAVQALGWELLSKESITAGLTPVKFPPGVDGGKLLNRLKDEYGIWFTGGQASLKGKIMRIAHMGFIGPEDLLTGFDALETVLNDLGVKAEKGKARQAFSGVLEKERALIK
jgi:serine---pyruvate transaminase